MVHSMCRAQYCCIRILHTVMYRCSGMTLTCGTQLLVMMCSMSRRCTLELVGHHIYIHLLFCDWVDSGTTLNYTRVGGNIGI